MNLHICRFLAIDALRLEKEIAQEQQEYLLLQRVYWHSMNMGETELQELHKRLKLIARSGRFSAILLEYLLVMVRTRIRAIQRMR